MAEKPGGWRFELTEDADADAYDERDGDDDFVDADDDGGMSDGWGDDDDE
jgi:hypothetical protein